MKPQYTIMLFALKNYISYGFKISSHLSSTSNLIINSRKFVSIGDMSMQDRTYEKKRVCIVGGGFGGLYTALKVEAENKGFEVTLIDSKEKFAFLPLLYELAVGTANILEVAPKYEDLLRNSNIRFIKGSVSDVNLENQTVGIHDMSDKIVFDQIVIAVGAQPRINFIPGGEKYLLPFYSLDDAYRLRKELKRLKNISKNTIKVIVIGGGYSGVEVATNIVKSLGEDRSDVTIIDRNTRIMKASADFNRQSAEQVLVSYGIKVKYNTSVDSVDATGLYILDADGVKSKLSADLILCTAGTQQSPLLSTLPLSKDSNGRLIVDSTLKCKGSSNVFAIGDCSVVEGDSLPATAQVAMQQSGILAKNLILNSIHTSDNNVNNLEKFRFVNLGEMLTLGSSNASMSSFGGLVELNGLPAAFMRRVAYAIRMPTPTQTVNALVGASIGTAGSVFLSFLENRLKEKKGL